MKDLAKAAKTCDKANIASLESSIKELTATQDQINKWLESMTPEQYAEIQRLCTGQYINELEATLTGLAEATSSLPEELGPEGAEKLKPVLDAFEETLAPFIGLLISFSFP